MRADAGPKISGSLRAPVGLGGVGRAGWVLNEIFGTRCLSGSELVLQ